MDIETIKSLLYKTVQNLALNEIRRRKLKNGFGEALKFIGLEEVKFLSMDDSLIERNDLRLLRLAIEKVPIEFRQVLLLSEFSDLSYGEIALALDIAEGTVASRKSRALQLLRDQFKKLEDQQNG